MLHGVAPSVASRQIATLERAFNTRLIARTIRRLSLTPAGSTLLDWATSTSASFEEPIDELGAMQHQPTGTIRISCNDYAGSTLLPGLFAKFCRLYPDLRIQLSTSNDPISLLKGDCDMALCAGRAPNTDLVCRRVLSYERRVCASPDYLAVRPPPTSIGELADHNCITHTHDEQSSWSFAVGGELVTQSIRPHIESDNFLAIFNLVHAGLGVARLSESMVRPSFQSGALIELLSHCRCVYPDGGLPGTWLLFPDRKILFRTRLLADFVVKELEQFE